MTTSFSYPDLYDNQRTLWRGRRDQVEIIRKRVAERKEQRPDAWFSEQAAILAKVEATGRLLHIIASNGPSFDAWLESLPAAPRKLSTAR